MSATQANLELRTVAPFDVSALRGFLAVHAIPGRDRVGDGGSSEHAVDVPGGLAVATIRWDEVVGDGLADVIIPVDFELPGNGEAADLEAAVRIVRRMLDLDAPMREVAAELSSDDRLAGLVGARPGLRVPGARNLDEFALGTVLGQQVSIAAGCTLQGRLVEHFGRSAPDLRGFSAGPDVARIARTPAPEIQAALRLTGARAETLRTLAIALSAGLRLDSSADQVQTRAALLELRGIGPWTVEMIAMRALGDRDAFPAGDLILRKALEADTDREVRGLGEAWRPYRAYATQHLWAEYLA